MLEEEMRVGFGETIHVNIVLVIPARCKSSKTAVLSFFVNRDLLCCFTVLIVYTSALLQAHHHTCSCTREHANGPHARTCHVIKTICKSGCTNVPLHPRATKLTFVQVMSTGKKHSRSRFTEEKHNNR